MTSGSGSAKRALTETFFALGFIAILLHPAASAAQGGIKQFTRQTTLSGNVNVAMLIVGMDSDAKDVEKLMDIVAERANQVASNLDPQNPAGDLARINASAGKGSTAVSPDTIFAFEEAEETRRMTRGWFDITAAGQGGHKDVRLDKSAGTVELRREGMQVSFDGMIDGFLAEYMLRLIASANMQNAMIKAGNVFRASGSGLTGPWKIQVQDDSGTYAHRAMNLVVQNSGISTISATEYRHKALINPKNRQQISPPCRGVTIVMNNAAQAQGVAKAVFTAGPKEGMDLLKRIGTVSGMIVDNEGKFMRTPGF